MSYRMDTADERVFYNGTLPDPSSTGLTILGWVRLRVDTNTFATYWRTSDAGGNTIQTCATATDGLGVNLFTVGGSLTGTYANAVDQWVHIAVVDDGATTIQYVTPAGGAIVSQSGAVFSGTPAQVCIGGRRSGDASESFNGAFQYVRVFAAALTQEQVEVERESTSAVLDAWADWTLSTGTDLADASGNARDLTAVAAGATTEEDPPISSPGGEGTALLELHATGTGYAVRGGAGAATVELQASGAGRAVRAGAGDAVLQLAAVGEGSKTAAGAGVAVLVLRASGVRGGGRDIDLTLGAIGTGWDVGTPRTGWTVGGLTV